MSHRASSRPPRIAALALALAACDPTTPATDAGLTDASLDAVALDAALPAPVPVSLTLRDPGGATLTLASDPGALRLTAPDGAVLVEATDLPLEAGLAAGGDARFHDPLVDAPRGVRWSPLTTGLEARSETEALLRDAEGHAANVTLTQVAPGVFRARVAMLDDGADTALLRLRLAATEEAYHGLGERFLAADARGALVPMQLSVTSQVRESGTNEHHTPVPFVVSSRGWGLFVETREAGAFDVARTEPDALRITFEGPVLDLVFFVASRPADVIAAYTAHTGLPILPPRWASAPMHWRNEWPSRAVLEADMADLRRLDIPATSFWIDNPWQTSYNDHRVDPARFPDPPGMLAAMREAGFVPLVWTTPYLERPSDPSAPASPAEALYPQFDAISGLIASDSGDPLAAPGGIACCDAPGMIDFTSSAARDLWRAQLESVVGLGVRAFKLDYGEDIVPEVGGARLGLRFADGTSERETHGLYATLYHTPYRELLDSAATGGEGGFLLARAEVWGGQRVIDVIWPGDLDNDLSVATEENVGGLPAAIAGMISLAASGFPHFASDTGGYRGGQPTREALLRWAEHTAFSPMLQLGGAGEHHNPWLPPYDDEAGRLYQRLARAHMALVPYLRVLALAAHETGAPTVLHPALAYPDDRAGYADPNAYLLGPDLFVAPTVEPGATTRAVHLPPGRWIDFWTREPRSGDVVVPAPLGRTPVFVRVGALLPLLPDDLDTLAATAGDAVVGPEDRPFLRAWILPATARTVRTEEGLDVTATRTASGVELSLSTRPDGPALPGGRALTELRATIELTHAEPPIDPTTLLGVTVDGATIAPAADRASVEAGCTGTCWALDGDVLVLSAGGLSTTPRVIAVR